MCNTHFIIFIKKCVVFYETKDGAAVKAFLRRTQPPSSQTDRRIRTELFYNSSMKKFNINSTVLNNIENSVHD
ncbi:hypothetical protein B5E53_00310 [Eubacterium sp. An11]|nr:hypothetical protein B5E53_00310 [Eubacterium sp. An11]